IPTILNPAPAKPLSESIIQNATYITPNEIECNEIFKEMSKEQAVLKYPNKLIVTEGEKGAIYCNNETIIRCNGFLTEPIDTTGAGDTFNGAFAVAITEGYKINEAITFANAAASISIEYPG